MLDRVERSDVFNAMALAAVLLAMGFGLLWLFGFLSDTVDEGVFDIEGGEEVEVLASAQEEISRPRNEVTVRVGNGSEGRQGLAGRATRRLDGAGYGTLDPKNKDGEAIDESFVYYATDFKVEAIEVARLLNIPEPQVRPLLGDPGVATEGADIVVILGQTADF